MQETRRKVWRLSGHDPLSFLQATTTQDHVGQLTGETRWCCILDGHGRILAFLRAIPMEDGTVLLDGAPECQSGIDWISSISGLSKCSIEIEPLHVVSATQAFAADARTNAIAVSTRSDGLPGVDLIVDNDGDLPNDSHEFDRVATGWPLFGVDITSSELLNDTPLLALCTSFTKGCYRGQETVAKIFNLGHARRTYVRLTSDVPADWETGTEIVGNGSALGRITSAASEGGRTVAFAIAKAEVLEHEVVEASGIRAGISSLVLADLPEKPGSPPPPPRRSRTFGRH